MGVGFFFYSYNNNNKNHKDKVDEDDLLQAISLSRKMPQLESDILLMSNIMLASRKSSRKGKKQDRELTEPIRATHLSKEDSYVAAMGKS